MNRTYSNCMRLASSSLSLDFKSLGSFPEGDDVRAGSSSSGLGCMRVNGSSATRSLSRGEKHGIENVFQLYQDVKFSF